MTLAEADTIIAGLQAAFPNVRLEDDTPDVWRKYLAPLDFGVASAAVANVILHVKFFPSVAEFREFYRLERHNQPKPRPAEPPRSSEIPVWVQVWEWRRRQTHTARQAANTKYAHLPVTDRPPVRMRTFPQCDPEPNVGAYSWEEYNALEAEWRAAGCPSVGQVSELLEKVGT